MDNSTLIHDFISSIKDYQNHINEYLDENEKSAAKLKVKNLVEELCDIEFEAKKLTKAAEDTVKEFENANTTNVFSKIDEFFREKIEEQQNNRIENYSKQVIFEEVFGGGGDVTEIEEQTERTLDDSQYEDMGDSLLASNVFTPPLDPFSKKVIKNPFRNNKCNHIYDFDVISQYIKSRQGKARCPYIGCNNKNLTLRALVKDDVLQQRIETYLSQSQHNSS